MSYSRRWMLATLLFLLYGRVHAQDVNTDLFSGFKENKAKAVAALKNYTGQDTARVNALLRVVLTATFLKERQEVSPYREEALALSKKLNYSEGLARAYLATGNLHKSASDYPLALRYYDSVLSVAANLTSKKMMEVKAWTHELKGMVYHSQNNYYMALDSYFESLGYTAHNPLRRKVHLHTFIAEIYTDLNNLEKAEEYTRKALDLCASDSAAFRYSNVFFTAIDIYFAKKDLVTAEHYLAKMSPYIPHPTEVQLNFGYYMKKGHLHFYRQQYDSAFVFFQEAYQYAVKGDHRNSLSTALRFLSNTALKLGNTEAARYYAMQTLDMAEKSSSQLIKIDALANLAAYHNKKGDYQKAYALLEQAIVLKDSLLSETNIKQINTLTAMYESEKQQKEIIRLENEREKQIAEVRQQSRLNIVFVALIVTLLVLGYLGYANFKKSQQIARQQQSLQQQKITELEKDKQLLTIDAMLKGQEEERSRIAKDLHDGLGGLLSGTKLSFMNVKENVSLTPESAALFDKSLSMLDNTIGDLRKVAQNLMPEALVKFGLHEAVRDFCDSIQSTTGIRILYQEVGEKRKLDNTAEVFAYRIIQELVNNALKHAEAKQVLVQLTMSQDKTGITVEDDGKGFDKNKLAITKGAGMANIQYRLQYFSGTIDIVTSPGNGTSVNVELIA